MSAPLFTLAFCDAVRLCFTAEPTDDVLLADTAKVGSVVYGKGNCVVVSTHKDTGDPVFGRIVSTVACGHSD